MCPNNANSVSSKSCTVPARWSDPPYHTHALACACMYVKGRLWSLGTPLDRSPMRPRTMPRIEPLRVVDLPNELPNVVLFFVPTLTLFDGVLATSRSLAERATVVVRAQLHRFATRKRGRRERS